MKITKNKRGFVTDFMVDFWAFIAFTIILLLFFLIFSIQIGGCNQAREINVVSEGSDIVNEKMLLMNYLNSPYDSERTISELIAESHLEDDYQEFKDYTIDFFDQTDEEIFGYEVCSVMCIFEGEDIILEIRTDECYDQINGDHCMQNRMKIPMELSDDKKALTVALSYQTASTPINIRPN